MNLNDFKFVAVWEFWVHAGDAERFEAVYGPSGAWAKLFASDSAHGGTRLFRDERESRRYLTLEWPLRKYSQLRTSSRRESARVRSWRAGSLDLE